MNLNIRQLRPEEFFFPTQLMLEEDWTCLTEEYSKMYETKFSDIKTTLVAADAETDEPFGIISWSRFRPDYCHVQLYIVRKSFRGKGIGSQLWQEMFRRIGSECNCGIGADEMLTKYRDHAFLDEMLTKYRDRSGFVIQSPISSMQYKGKIEKLREYIQKLELPQAKVEPLNSNHLQEVAQLHKKAGGLFGIEYWKEWMQLRSPKSFVALNDSGNVIGFISGAPDTKNGLRIAPLYANSYILAMSLMKLLLDSFVDRNFDAVQLHVLNVNREMNDLMKQLNFEIYYVEHRLYTKRDEGLTADRSIVFSFGLD